MNQIADELRGAFFAKKQYDDAPVCTYEQAEAMLPEPVYDVDPAAVSCYRYAVKVLYSNIHRPQEGSGFVSNFVDAAFNDDIFLWDTSFMTLFCNLLHPYLPGICSLDNFYCKQRDDGEIPRELVRDTGQDFFLWTNGQDQPLYSYFHNHYGYRRLRELINLPYEEMYRPDLGRIPVKHPYYTLDNLNHPILAMAEWESYCHTEDISRLQVVWEPLFRQFKAMKMHLQHVSGLYVTDWASMDNSPRNAWLGLAVDTSCEMVLFARHLLAIGGELYRKRQQPREYEVRSAILEREVEMVSEAVNRYLWNEEDGFYYDVNFQMEQSGIKTAAAFWALWSGVAQGSRRECLAAWLQDQDTFRRVHRVPVLAANEPGYDSEGGYWRGSVWAPMNAMVVRGLESCGMGSLAAEIAKNHCQAVTRVFSETGTIWENYPADSLTSGNADHRDFVGWSGIGPILFLIRYGIGLAWDHAAQELVWNLDLEALKAGQVGCRRYWFAGKTASLVAAIGEEGIEIQIDTGDSFHLRIKYGDCEKMVDVTGQPKHVILSEAKDLMIRK